MGAPPPRRTRWRCRRRPANAPLAPHAPTCLHAASDGRCNPTRKRVAAGGLPALLRPRARSAGGGRVRAGCPHHDHSLTRHCRAARSRRQLADPTRTHPHAGGCGWLCGRLRVGFGRAERFSRRALVVGACGRDAMSTPAANDALALPSAAATAPLAPHAPACLHAASDARRNPTRNRVPAGGLPALLRDAAFGNICACSCYNTVAM